MNEQRLSDFLSSRKKGQRAARKMHETPQTLDATGMSEYYLLRGDLAQSTFWTKRILSGPARFIQTFNLVRHFDHSATGAEVKMPTQVSWEWVLPVLRSVASMSDSPYELTDLVRFMEDHVPDAKPDAKIKALLVLCNAARNRGGTDMAVGFFDKAVRLASESGIRLSDVPADAGSALSFMRRRQAAFHDLVGMADFRSYSLFPCSGTMLGLYRDHDFIPSDGDVDIGCLDESGYLAIKALLRSSGCFHVSSGRLPTNFKAKHVLGPTFDVSLYIRKDGGLAKTSHVYEWRFNSFGLMDFVTDYGRLPVPDPAEPYLESMYADWWVPRSGYDSRIDSPNVKFVSRTEATLVLSAHLLTTYMAGDGRGYKAWKKKLARLPVDMREASSRMLSRLPD